MRERLLSLAERRARLAVHAQAEREQLVVLLAPADAAATVAVSLFQAGRRAVEEARRHPLILAAIVVLLVALRPRRVFGLLLRGWSLWRLYRGASGWWRRFAAVASAPPRPVR